MMETVAPIIRRKVYEQVAEHLMGQITEGRLKPGDAIPTERDLTRSYRVGRSSVREALRMLESQGLIKSLGSGTFVVDGGHHLLHQSLHLLLALDKVNLQELYEVRKVIEAEAAALAAARRTADNLIRIRQAVEQMAAGLGSQEQFSAADLSFHLEVAAATRNRVITHVMNGIRDLLHRALASVYRIPGTPARVIEEHRAIARAIEAGRADAARREMLQHLARVEDDIRSVLAPAADPGQDRAGSRGVRADHGAR